MLPWLLLALDAALGPAVPRELDFVQIPLPPLQIQGQGARAHTQGLERVGTNFYVTARLESVSPKRAVLLRTAEQASAWRIWDLTLTNSSPAGALDHPGGIQSDGKRLWIPIAQSVPHGKSRIRVFPLDSLQAGEPKAELDIPIEDHVGAIAISSEQQLAFGASWDTETIYVWDFQGRLQKTLGTTPLTEFHLGWTSGPNGREGVAVQDWKLIEGQLFASGLYKEPRLDSALPRSRLLIFDSSLAANRPPEMVRLPRIEGTEIAREAMAISIGFVYFLPEDLDSSNRLFRVPLQDLLSRREPFSR